MTDQIKLLNEELEKLQKAYDFLLSEKSKYENGDAKLYYALQRKMSEMANTLNKQNLESIDLDSKDSKTFDRVVMILQKCETISSSASALGQIAGITGDEQKDITKKPFVETIAESRK